MNVLPPRYTQVPNELLDNLQDFSKAEIVMLMVLCRITFGYHREIASASNAQVGRMAGMAITTVIRTAKSLTDKGIIEHRINSRGISEWTIVIKEETEPAVDEPKKYTPDQETMYDKAKALADVCRIDLKANKGMLLGTAKKLPLSAAEIIELFGQGGAWYQYDFRGKKNSPPMLKQISTEFVKMRQAMDLGTEQASGPSNAMVKDGEIYV
jgi:hypothetical protein